METWLLGLDPNIQMFQGEELGKHISGYVGGLLPKVQVAVCGPEEPQGAGRMVPWQLTVVVPHAGKRRG